MSGRRAKTLRRLAAIYRTSLQQEPDAEVRDTLRQTFGVGLRVDERRLLRRAMKEGR